MGSLVGSSWDVGYAISMYVWGNTYEHEYEYEYEHEHEHEYEYAVCGMRYA